MLDETRDACRFTTTGASRYLAFGSDVRPAVREKHTLTAAESFLPTQSKMLKCADNEDIITMKADDAGDVVTFMFESPGTLPIATRTSRATRDPEPGPRSRHRLASGFSNSAELPAHFRHTKLAHRKRRHHPSRSRTPEKNRGVAD